MLIAKLNVVGPSGEQIFVGDPIPKYWPDEIQQSLLQGGGAEEVEGEDEPG